MRWSLFIVVTALLAGATAVVLASSSDMASAVRNPLYDFVQPGVTVWWFVLGGPFRDTPSTASGITFAAVANAVLWSVVLWLALAVYRLIRRRYGR